MTDEEFREWNAKQRGVIATYLEKQGIRAPNIGEWPAFEMAPHFGIWCIESQKQAGKIGWWAFAGDCPTDYVSERGECHPRSALRELVYNWEGYAAHMVEGCQPPDTTFETAGHDLRELGDLLERRVGVLKDWLATDELWEDR
ncbi:DUF4826 family protein [Aeoliella sp.]|uniref:DUF4826 family protein n=1 Tax=Aeoliella sp. TaxID=2795800 RepID=UPI003CCBB28E